MLLRSRTGFPLLPYRRHVRQLPGQHQPPVQLRRQQELPRRLLVLVLLHRLLGLLELLHRPLEPLVLLPHPLLVPRLQGQSLVRKLVR